MTTLAVYLLAAFVAGFAAVALRLPPLVGFLVAGFALEASDVEELPGLETLADLGVTLLLFGIGLKLDARTLLRREVWLTTVAHVAFSVAIAVGGLGLLMAVGFSMLADESLASLALLGFALSFSSTVFVVKVLEERNDATTSYGQVAIGVLVMQDLIAVLFLTSAKGHPPSPWALALVLLVPATWLLRRMWSRIGHGEMQALFGVLMALVPGYWLFETVGVKGDLGALVMGALLASHPAAGELSRSLWNLKELLLVGFFVSIGLTGTPSWEGLAIAAALLLLLPLQAVGYGALLSLLGLRHRNAALAGLALTNYSEFGLIVVAVGGSVGWIDGEWLVVLAVAVALSFLLSAALNRARAHDLANWLEVRLPARPPRRLLPSERPIDIAGSDALVLGMGRVGRTCYTRLCAVGLDVLGVEHDAARADELAERGLNVVRADATDRAFWQRVVHAGDVGLAVLAMPFHGSNVEALERLRDCGFTGRVAAVAQYDDDVAELERLGADAVFHLYGGAGAALAEAALGEDPTQGAT
ncbi:cation:proton antiporter domain-containing protein [Nocardioides sp. SYSU DS0651]|uniref:cation:proton antiporter domain-containing protein n=1 Tax=Nocardioides sp. SYSU DS0651 TaxID=3415955 RepID=UPI003F4B3B92